MQTYSPTAGGQLNQDIVKYGRHCDLYECFKPGGVRNIDGIESSVNPRWDADYHAYANGLGSGLLLQATTDGTTSTTGVVTVSPQVIGMNGQSRQELHKTLTNSSVGVQLIPEHLQRGRY